MMSARKGQQLARIGSAGRAIALLAGLLASVSAFGQAAPGAGAAKPATGAKNRYQRSRLTYDESEATADKRRLLLSTGEDKAIDLNFDAIVDPRGVSIGNPKVVATQIVKIGDKKQMVFKPLSKGETTVTVRDTDGTLRLIFTVRVTDSNLLRMASEIRSLLRDVEGLEIRIVGPKIVLDGDVLVPNDYGKLLLVVNDPAYTPFVLNLAGFSPIALGFLAKKMQEDINTFAPNVRTRVVNGQIFLEGTVDSKDQADRSAKVASSYLPEVRPKNAIEQDEKNINRLPPRGLIQSFIVINAAPPKKQDKLVRVTVHFVQLAKDYTRLFGFKWQPGFSSDPSIAIGNNAQGISGSGASFTATISSLIPRLNSAQSAGYARVLKTGTIVIQNGKAAQLNDTESQSVALAGPNGVPISTTVSSGLNLAVTPTIQGQTDDVQMEIKMSQSAVSGQASSSGSPKTAQHSVQTFLFVKSNESAAIASVTDNNVTTAFNKNDPSPGVFEGNTQPLFSLLRSKNFNKNRSQFVIFVTPQIIDSASEASEDLKKNFRVKVN